VTASRIIAAVDDEQNLLVLGMAIVGVISNDTQSQATISSVVEIIVDVRCSTGQMTDDLCAVIFRRFDEIVHKENKQTSYRVFRKSP
jgi:hypothetical protein